MSAFPDTPATLLAKIAVQVTGQTNELAWVRFFELYEPAIRKFAEYQGAKTETEDIAQEIAESEHQLLQGPVLHDDAGREEPVGGVRGSQIAAFAEIVV